MTKDRTESGSTSSKGATALEIVICTYNRASDLDLCLSALARQKADPHVWRVTVIDNNCTDATPQVVERWAATGRLPGLVRVTEPLQGLTPARQRGVRSSRADWIALVDDDCMVSPDWISEALRFGLDHPEAGAFGGRVRPNWGGTAPAHLARNGWLFAEQDHGHAIREVDSLVGAGVVLNRRWLNATGWTSHPLLADRMAKGHTSGGDVEISLRLRISGHALFYVPSMSIEHLIAPSRQRVLQSLGLARGLGAGAELINLMCAEDQARWLATAPARLRLEISQHIAGLPLSVLRRTFGWDWIIRAAFLVGQRDQARLLQADAAARSHLAGMCAEGSSDKERFTRGGS